MARLTLEGGTTLDRAEDIARELARLGIRLSHWPIGEDPYVRALLDKPSLADDEKEAVLQGMDRYFEQLKASDGYQTRDLIVLHPGIPNLDQMIEKFTRCHTHADPEVRYIVDGEGAFGFVGPDGAQIELLIEAGEYINVPAGAEHWFHLTPTKRIKAVRYFTDMAGWAPEYTSTVIRM